MLSFVRMPSSKPIPLVPASGFDDTHRVMGGAMDVDARSDVSLPSARTHATGRSTATHFYDIGDDECDGTSVYSCDWLSEADGLAEFYEVVDDDASEGFSEVDTAEMAVQTSYELVDSGVQVGYVSCDVCVQTDSPSDLPLAVAAQVEQFKVDVDVQAKAMVAARDSDMQAQVQNIVEFLLRGTRWQRISFVTCK